MLESIEDALRLARGATADVYPWGDDRVLKLFDEHIPIHALEVSATRVAHEAGLPVPAVIDGLIEVGEREGIVFQRLDGPTLADYLQDRPEQVADWARQAAELHAQIHSTEAPGLPPLAEILHLSVQEAESLDKGTRQAVLDLLHGLPQGNALCHNDFYPRNLIVSGTGLCAIDWAIGTRGNPLADCARTWLISRMWLGGLEERAPEHVFHVWQQFWETYFRRYGELRPYSVQEFRPWQAVTAAASLCWEGSRIATGPRVTLVQAVLDGDEHPWLIRRETKAAITCV